MCCHGMPVRLLCADEIKRVQTLGASLGVSRPVEADGRLRFDGGRCVFLGEDRLCNLHRSFGAAAKPHMCRQYPAVLVDTESDSRVGMDPGCFTAISTWRSGDPLAANAPLAPQAIVRDPDQAAFERGFLDLSAREGTSVASLLRTLTDHEPGQDLPRDLASEWVRQLQRGCLDRLLASEEHGEVVRVALTPVAKAAPGWDAAAPPAWPTVGPDEDAFAVEVVRRLIFLRLGGDLPVDATAMLGLLGAVAIGWTDPNRRYFGAAMSAWSRAVRVPTFVNALWAGADTRQAAHA